MLEIAELTPTQDGYRLPRKTRETMMSYVAQGGVYNQQALDEHTCTRKFLIAITRFPDGRLFLRDGLHRTTSIWLSRSQKILLPEEFFYEDMTYDMYTEAAPEKGWYTPFDPRTHVRKPDFLNFKQEAVEKQERGDDDLLDWIYANADRYSVPRNGTHTIPSLAALWAMPSEVLL